MDKKKQEKFMARALEIASRARRKTWPNPMVGALLVKNERIIGEGFHEFFGGKHAEINAIKNAGKKAKNASLFVTLEPCTHFGKQPPCAPQVVKAGIKQVYIASSDPNQKKRGIAYLKKNKIKVHLGVLETEALELNKEFFKHAKTGLPFVTIKIAVSLDGKLTWGDGKNKAVSSLQSKQKVLQMRKDFQAIMVGKNTVLKDNPRLTSRDKKSNPIRVIVASDAKIPLNYNIFSSDAKTIVACTKKAAKKQVEKLIDKGVGVIVCKQKNGHVDLVDLLKQLGSIGIASVLVETGQKMFEKFTRQKLFDKLVFIVSPKKIGKGKGIKFSQNLFKKLKLKKFEKIGSDAWLYFEKR